MTDEANTNMVVYDQNGLPVEVFVKKFGGRIFLLIRSNTEEELVAAALSQEIMYMETETLTDANGVSTEVQTGNILLADGIELDYLNPDGPYIITPAVLNEDGEVVTPAVTDDRFHVNMKISGPAVNSIDETTGLLKWVKTAITWSQYGTDDTISNNHENAKLIGNVGLIDPLSISSPSRVWL